MQYSTIVRERVRIRQSSVAAIVRKYVTRPPSNLRSCQRLDLCVQNFKAIDQQTHVGGDPIRSLRASMKALNFAEGFAKARNT